MINNDDNELHNKTLMVQTFQGWGSKVTGWPDDDFFLLSLQNSIITQCGNKELQTMNAKLKNDISAIHPQIDQKCPGHSSKKVQYINDRKINTMTKTYNLSYVCYNGLRK